VITNISVLYVSLRIQASFTNHLSWVTFYLGFHIMGVYIHNDSIVAFGLPLSQILIDPLVVNHQMLISILSYLGPADLLTHHSISLGLHVTTLILCKGIQDANGSHIIPDKIHMNLSFACDGPTRNGTCDATTFDSIYLA
jgi:photosystem I P700 chlorophyll a apoprotein A2